MLKVDSTLGRVNRICKLRYLGANLATVRSLGDPSLAEADPNRARFMEHGTASANHIHSRFTVTDRVA